ncbi:hypothetical protein AB0M05_35075 [Streptomyces violaceusniger]|uniref:DUF6197 family protein n=1 Tax=Streptomyces violaceusniger TaxID=68280 RepID=UPI00343AD144
MLTTPTPNRTHQPHTTSTEPDLETRMALTEAAMTVRLETAALAVDVSTAHILTTPIDLEDIVRVPDAIPEAPVDLYPTPVAALLQRAHQRLLTGGWCKDTLVDEDGARCMLGSIRAEARGDSGLESSAVAVLLDAIRRTFGDDVDSVPSFNDAFARGRVPIRMVDQAAHLADARGL